jgi:hypothetical protein
MTSNKYRLELQYLLKKTVESLQPKIIEKIGSGNYSRELNVQVKNKRIVIPITNYQTAAKRIGSFQ